MIRLDLNTALQLWEHELGTIKNVDTKESTILEFIDKEGNVVGNFTTVPGNMTWEYPKALVDTLQEINACTSYSRISEYIMDERIAALNNKS